MVTTMTVPTPVHSIPTCLCHSQVFRTISKHPLPIPNPVALSQANSHLKQCTPKPSDSLPSHQCIPDPMLLQPSLFFASSWFPISTPIPNLTLIWPSLFLHQVYSWWFIGLATAVRWSLMAYLFFFLFFIFIFFTTAALRCDDSHCHCIVPPVYMATRPACKSFFFLLSSQPQCCHNHHHSSSSVVTVHACQRIIQATHSWPCQHIGKQANTSAGRAIFLAMSVPLQAGKHVHTS